MQSGLEIGEETITGTLNYIDNGPLLDHGGAGYYMALAFSNLDEAATSVIARITPNGEEPIELVGMENPKGVFKVTNTEQVLEIVSTDETNRTTSQVFTLVNLELVESDVSGD